ncbi:MAG: RNA polymerase sigma factor RpoD, partial [Alphaproteobacteria bacterium]
MAMQTQDATPAKEETPESPTPDGPILDLKNAAVKRMIKESKKRGWVTVDELNAVLPSEEVTSEQIEDTMSMLNDMGINVVESEDTDSEAEGNEGASGSKDLVESASTTVVKKTTKREPTDRTDDPVRMYLREMGSVELLSREGEIAIAKRIEAGREAMIAGLCESPLTFQAIIIWCDQLSEGAVLLRDIIDLEATYAGPDAKAVPANPAVRAGVVVGAAAPAARASVAEGAAAPAAGASVAEGAAAPAAGASVAEGAAAPAA